MSEPKAQALKKTHVLKTWPEYYRATREGRKTFEVRKNDRGFNVGDTLILQEWSPTHERYTGAAMPVRVKYVMNGGQFGIADDYVVMGIEAW